MSLPAQSISERVRAIVVATLPTEPGKSPTEMIFGPEGILDSLGLVNFLADLEYQLSQEFGRELVLANEQAMSRGRSPFRTVSSLTDYVVELLEP